MVARLEQMRNHEQMCNSLAMPSNIRLDELRLLTKISKLYYEGGHTQQEIADYLCISRPKVSRMLKQARDKGIVNITVLTPPGVHADLERQLESRFGLMEAVVVEEEDWESQESVARAVGAAAAQYVRHTLRDGDVIGVSWGATLSVMVDTLSPQVAPNAHIVQMVGGLGPPEAETHATELARRMAHTLGCKLTLLPAPGILDSEAAMQVMVADRHVERAFEMMSRINVAYVGIGAPISNSMLMRSGWIMTPELLGELSALGTVGDIALRFFTIDGQPVSHEICDRILGITVQQLKCVERVVGVSGGPEKRRAVRGALEGGLINVLITDYMTASTL
jgi:deoxyribonucleoside regulator